MNWNELRDRVKTIPTLEGKVAQFNRMIEEAKNEVAAAHRKYEKGQRDVERLNNDSFSTFLLRLVGRHEDKLEKKQLDEIHAKLDYDRAVTHQNSLISELAEIKKRVSTLKADESIFNAELAKRRDRLARCFTTQEGLEYTRLENQHAEIMSQITEVSEALQCARRAADAANRALDSLDSAEQWSTWDVFGGGIISGISKYAHIDDAEVAFNDLSHYLRELHDELRDIPGIDIPGLPNLTEISGTQRMVDLWFDNIFTDMSVHSKISNNLEETEVTLKNISYLITVLEAKLNSLHGDLQQNKRVEEALLLKYNL